jgi:hypothetical protein
MILVHAAFVRAYWSDLELAEEPILVSFSYELSAYHPKP